MRARSSPRSVTEAAGGAPRGVRWPRPHPTGEEVVDLLFGRLGMRPDEVLSHEVDAQAPEIKRDLESQP
jgi:hypothetical protein